MQKHPMLSVKEAAEALKIDERSVRDRLQNGTLKGEKKMVGLREKWFIYQSALSSALAKQDEFGGTASQSNTVTVQELPTDVFEATSRVVREREENSPEHVSPANSSTATVDNITPELKPTDATYGAMDSTAPQTNQQTPPAADWRAANQVNLQSIAEAFMKPLVDQIAAQEKALSEKQALIEAQERELEEQKIKLLLLPDLQKRAREDADLVAAAESRMLESLALQKQADMLAERANRELAEKEAQVSDLHAQVASVEEENKVLGAKASEAQVLAANLEALSKKVEELQKPWWKKMFVSDNAN